MSSSSALCVADEEVRHGRSLVREDTAALQAHARGAERLTEVGQCPRSVGQQDLQVTDAHGATIVGSTTTSLLSECAMKHRS